MLSVLLRVYRQHLYIMPAPLSLSSPRYLIPDWFLECNVKTAADLSATPSQIVFCNCADCKEAKADDDGGETGLADEECLDKEGHDVGKEGVKETSDSWSSLLAREVGPDELHYRTFAWLRDMTAAAFVADRDGKLIRPDSSPVVFRMERDSDGSSTCTYSDYSSTSFMEPVWMGRAVEQVARVLGVSLVALDLEVLEELGAEFYRQDKEVQTRKAQASGDAAISLTSTSGRPKRHAEANQDGGMTNATSVEGSGNKHEDAQQAEVAQEAEDIEDNSGNASLNQQQWEPDVCSLSAFLSHYFGARAERKAPAGSWQRTQLVWTLILDAVRDKLATESTASEILGGIPRPNAVIFHITDYRSVDYIVKRRVLTRFAGMLQQRRKQGDAVVMIVSTDDTTLEPGRRLQRKIGATPASTVIVPWNNPGNLAIREQSYNGAINVRALKHCLRVYCAHLFPTDLLKVTADWACAERGKSIRAFGGTMWTSTDMSQIVTLIMGRAWLKSELRFADIRAVLKRLGFYNPVEPETQDASESGNTPEAATTEKDVSEILKGLDLNSYEQELAQCIVDPGKWVEEVDFALVTPGRE